MATIKQPTVTSGERGGKRAVYLSSSPFLLVHAVTALALSAVLRRLDCVQHVFLQYVSYSANKHAVPKIVFCRTEHAHHDVRVANNTAYAIASVLWLSASLRHVQRRNWAAVGTGVYCGAFHCLPMGLQQSLPSFFSCKGESLTLHYYLFSS